MTGGVKDFYEQIKSTGGVCVGMNEGNKKKEHKKKRGRATVGCCNQSGSLSHTQGSQEISFNWEVSSVVSHSMIYLVINCIGCK